MTQTLPEPSPPPPRGASDAWTRAMQNVPREHGFEALEVEGTLPDALRGTCYRNGPGLVELLGRRYGHWFDGDGLISAVRFEGGEARGAARLCQTAGLREERAKGRPYFGAFGTTPPGFFDPRRVIRAARGTSKNPANTAVMSWADRLFALCEIGRPFELDPETLDSIGETDLDGVIPRAFSAHPHGVAARGALYNIGTRIGRPNALDLFVMRDDGTAGRLTTLPLEAPTMVHDFAVTERHAVIFVAPLRLQLLPTLLGRRAFVDSLVWDHARGTEVILVPLDAPASARRFRVPAFWAWHFGNAFERDGQIVVDLVRYRDFPTSAAWLAGIARREMQVDGADGILGRAVIDPKRESLEFTPLRSRTGEFPRVAPEREARSARVVYWTEHSNPDVGRSGPPDTVVRVDVERGDADAFTFPEGQYPSEAVFAPRPGSEREDDGWLIASVYDARRHRTSWAVLDAARPSRGPIATAHMRQHVPLTFHGVWKPTR